MEAIKSAVGLGKKDQEGQEPVSGVKGEGTAAEPFDAGNQESNPELGGKAPQETDPSKVTGQPTTDTKPADEATTSGKSAEPAPAPVPAPAPTQATDSETSKASASSSGDSNEKPKIGSPSWFKTAIPLGKRKGGEDESEKEPQAMAGAATTGGSVEETKETEAGLPPNHLGEDVPKGHDVEADLDSTATKVEDTTGAASHPDQADAEKTEVSRDTSETAKDDQTEQKPGFFTGMFASSSKNPSDESGAQAPPTSSSLPGTKAPIQPEKSDEKESFPKTADKQRRASEAHGSNPGAIPTAGGKPLGYRASEDRERRRSQMPSSIDLPRAESSKAVASSVDSTEANTAASAQAGAAADSATPIEKSDDMAEAAKSSDVPSSSTEDATRSPSTGGKESRRKSVFGKIKEKIHH